MKYYHGIAVSPGVAIGLVSVVANNKRNVIRRSIFSNQVDAELRRLDDAVARVRAAIEACRDNASSQLGAQYGQIFEAHLLFLDDAKLRAMIEKAIRHDNVCAEYAVSQAFDYYAQLLSRLSDAEYAERANDVVDVKNQLVNELIAVARRNAPETPYNSIVAASFLAPSDAAKIDPERVSGVVMEEGGRGSHTSIVASALGIPTIVGLGPFLADVLDDTLAIVDGDNGRLILDPTPEVVSKYQEKADARKRTQERLEVLSSQLRARTKLDPNEPDKIAQIAVEANIEFPYEAKTSLEKGAAGIGLYRTEFLFLANQNGVAPDEETHFQAYKQALETMGDRPTVIRTFDLGADKTPEGRSFSSEREPNPFMGLRSIRLSLRHTEMFRVQIRAILRASVYGNVSVMFPLVTTIREFRQAKMIFNDVREGMAERGAPFAPKIPLGIMVETPATVIMLDQFASEVDFFSIGTNDLLQYTQAVDRSNKEVNALYAQESPALLRLIQRTVEVANAYGKPVALCGQMAGVPANIPLLIGLGLRAVSVPPSMILETKEVCEAFTLEECKEIARTAWRLESADDVRVYLRNELKKRIASYDD